MSVGLYDYTNPFFDTLSISLASFVVPSHFDVYTPDNQSDYICRFVMVPNPAKGATSWTMNGQFITIGVYRDEGRPAGRASMLQSSSWTRNATTLTFQTVLPHGLNVGDEADFTNINVSTYRTNITSVIDSNTFTIRTLYTGGLSGGVDAVCWPTKIVNYYSENIVFRLLPSFQLVEYATIQNIIEATAPVSRTNALVMYDITKSAYRNVPIVKDANFSYDILGNPQPNVSSNLRYNQQFDSSGNPLPLAYQANGQPSGNRNVNSKYMNSQISYNYQPVPSGGLDGILHVYDFYGLDINDSTRSPFYSAPIVYRDITIQAVIGNFGYATTTDGKVLYNRKFLNDAFGNMAIGVQFNNTLVVRKQVLPVALDNFNKPIKQPTSIMVT